MTHHKRTAEILDAARTKKPDATLVAFSGGTDSLTAYLTTRGSGHPIDGLVFVDTRTGIPQTREYVEAFAAHERIPLYIADAGTTYRDYVLRKGFFGRGSTAHTYAYHLLKIGPLRTLLSREFRKGQRDYWIHLINGARTAESQNRTINMRGQPFRQDGKNKNVWVSPILHWTNKQKHDLLEQHPNTPRNPVATKLCRSGECLCGTMQSPATRTEAAHYYPEWGAWLDTLEQEVYARGHTWGWGEDVNSIRDEIAGGAQLLFEDFMPMCVGCNEEQQAAETFRSPLAAPHDWRKP